MGPLGVQEMIAIFVIALLLFGPKKLPELGRTLGKALSEFRRAKNELKSTFESHMSELEREIQWEKQSNQISDYSSPHYPYPYDEYGRHDSDNGSTHGSDATNKVETPTNFEGPESGANQHVDTANPTAASNQDVSSNPPIPGTIPHSNGVQPSEAVSTEEKPSA